MANYEENKKNEVIETMSEEAKKNFILFLEEVKKESVNCGVVNHSNFTNFSMW